MPSLYFAVCPVLFDDEVAEVLGLDEGLVPELGEEVGDDVLGSVDPTAPVAD